MPNLQGYNATIVAGSFSSAHDISFTGEVFDDHGHLVGDFTGANVVSLLTVLNTLNAAQGLTFAALCRDFLLKVKFPALYPDGS